jgi:flagellar protein FliL
MAEDKDDANKPTEAATAPKNNTLLFVIIAVLATLLLAAIGFGVYLMTHQGPHPVQEGAEAGEQAAAAEKPAKKKDGKKKDEPKEPAIYVSLEPPFVVNFEPKASSRFMQVTVELMTRDPATAQMLKDNNPLVRNNLLMLFGSQDPATVNTRDGKEALRKQALDTVRELIRGENGKPEKMEAVFFTSFVMQ